MMLSWPARFMKSLLTFVLQIDSTSVMVLPNLSTFDSAWLDKLEAGGVHSQLLFLTAETPAIIKRFSETRRRHPLSDKMTALQEALVRERDILKPIANSADITIDTSQMLFHELRDYVQQLAMRDTGNTMSTLIQSFGFKKGLPLNADLVFDVRCLPNPHWVPSLRSLTGADPAVIAFLQTEPAVNEMYTDMRGFLEKWLVGIKITWEIIACFSKKKKNFLND